MSSPEIDHRDRRSSSLNRNSGGRYEYGNNRQYSGRDRSNNKSEVVATGFPIDVTDREIKEEILREIERFGDILSVQVRGRDQNRQAYINFSEEDAARELRRFCLERHLKINVFQRTIHFDFDNDAPRGGGGGGDYNRGNNQNRANFNQRNNYKDYKNDRFNDKNDNDRDRGGRNFNQGGGGRDRFNNDNHINPRATRTLFVGNLEHSITKEELMRIFDHWGAIDDIDVKRPPNGIPAYAFIKYLELEAAACAKNQMFGKEIKGRPIKVGYGKTLPSTRLWVGGLGAWCSTEILNREFDRFGALRNIEYNKGDRHAFVEFESLDAASAAHAEMRGFPLGGPDRKIKIDYAEAKGRQSDDRDRERDFDNRSNNDDREHNRGNFNRYENNRNDNQGNYGRGRGSNGNSNNRRSESERDNEDRNERRRTRSRSPMNGDRGAHKPPNSPPSRGASPQKRTKNESSPPPSKTVNDSSTKQENDKPTSTTSNESTNKSKPQESLVDVAKRFVVAWRGAFALKNSAFPVRMHLIGGNPDIANFYLRGIGSGAGPALKILSITQRLRLDPTKLDEVTRRIQQSGAGGHCMLLALPTGDDVELDGSFQRRPLKSLVTYFKKKEAAGVIMMSSEDSSGKLEETGMLHAFPPCEFSQQLLLKAAPNAGAQPSNEDHLIIIVVKGTTT